ncbi:MAG: hypothetical protein ABJA79_03515 [Parafilimonas sp.]
MKTILSFISVVILLCAIASCKKSQDPMNKPSIAFKTGAGYTSSDTTVSAGDTVLVGITASKAATETQDVLKTFNVSESINGGAETTIYTHALTGTEGDSFDIDLNIVTATAGTTEKYTFTVVNRDGLINSVSLTLTVN